MNLSQLVSVLKTKGVYHREAPHLILGKWGERKAEQYLRKHTSLKLLGRRVRVGKHDELDLIAREGSIFVVIEVKTRTTHGMRPARDAVDKKKQWKLNRAAVRYVQGLSPAPDGIRFDIVEVIGSPKTKNPEINHYPGAFGLHHSFRV